MTYRLNRIKQHLLLRMPRTQADWNVLYLYTEVLFAGILTAAGAFNAAYVLRLGGSNSLVGLLSSLPALVAVFLYLPAARFLERKTNYAPWVVGSLLTTRLGYLLIFALPFVLNRLLPELTVATLVAMTAPSVLFSTGWSPLLSDIVPADRRAAVLAGRSMLSSAAVASLTYIAGLLLDQGEFPRNYQTLYLVGLLGGLLSVFFVSRIRFEGSAETTVTEPEPPTRGMSWRENITTAMRRNKGFTRIIINTLLFNLAPWMTGPIFSIYYVRTLGASDSWIGLHSTLAHVGVVVGYWLWRRIIKRVGEHRALLTTAPLMASYAFSVALVPDLTFILGATLVFNLIAPGMNLSHGVLFLEMLPPGRKHSWTALYSMIMNVGAFVAPLVGVAIANRIGVVPTLLIAGTMRLLTASLFHFFPIKEKEAPAELARPLPQPRMFR